MKGDFSRLTFRPDQHYSRVLQQQGRPQLDADWNEQADIQGELPLDLLRRSRRRSAMPHKILFR